MALDKRIPSSNTIKKVLDEQSAVSKYLEEAKAELEKEKFKSESAEKHVLRENIESLIETRDIVKDNINNIFSQRNKLYENLISAILGKYYGDIIIKNLEIYRKNKTLSQDLSIDPNARLRKILDEIYETLVFIEGLNKEEQRNLVSDGCTRLNQLAAELEEIFMKSKGPLGFDDAEVDECGNLTGLGEIYNVPDIAEPKVFNSSLEFYRKDDSGNKKKLPTGFEIADVESEEIEGTLKLDLIRDVKVEDGSEAAPFLIYTKKQFTEFLSRTKKDGKYYKLMADIKNIGGFGTVIITGNLDANGCSLSFAPSVRNIKFTGTIKGKLNVVGYGKFLMFSYFPIFIPLGITLGQTFKVDDEGELNIYVNLNSLMITPANPWISLLGSGKFITVTTVGTIPNDSADKVNFYWHRTNKTGFKDEYKLGFKLYAEDPNDATQLTRKSSDYQKKTTKYAQSIDFKSNPEYSNPILKKGETIEFSGKIIKEDGNYFIVDENEGEEEPNRVQYFKTADGYAADYANVRMEYKDDDDNAFGFYPFKSRNELPLKYIEGDDLPGTLKVLTLMAAIIALKNLRLEHFQPTGDIIMETPETEGKRLVTSCLTLLEQIEKLRESLGIFIEGLNGGLSEALEFISGSAHTFVYLEGLRAGSDGSYNNQYSSNLTSNFSSITGSVSLLAGDLGEDVEVDEFKEFNSMCSTGDLIQQECLNLTLGISESIIMMNKTIENYLVLFDLTNNYGTEFYNILKTTSNLIKDLYSTKSIAYKVVRYGGFRSFVSWEDGLKEFSNDGIFDHGQLFISQELGLNAQDRSIEDRDLFSSLLKYLSNDALIRACKKSLLINDITRECKNIFNYEEQLERDNSIITNLDATYEKISPVILAEVSELEKFQNVDISKILEGIDFFDILLNTSSNEETDEMNGVLESKITENKRIGNLIEIIFVKHLFSDKEKGSSGLITKIKTLKEIFTNCEKTFRNMLLEYYFYKTCNRIINNSINMNENNEYCFITESNINELGILLGDINTTIFDKRRLLEKYIAVWMFNNFIHYGGGGTVLPYIDGYLEAIEEDVNTNSTETNKKFLQTFPLTRYLLSNKNDYPKENYIASDGNDAWRQLSNGWNKFAGFIKDVWSGTISIF